MFVVVVFILKHQSPEALKLIKNHGFVQLILAAIFGYYSNDKP